MSRGIDSENELMLLLSATRRRREAAGPRLRTLIAKVDPDRFVELARRQRLLAILGERMLEVDGPRRPEIDQAARLERTRQEVQMLLFEAATSTLMERLESDGVPTLPLKGTVLARRAHGDAALRPITDIDLLVDASLMPKAVEIAKTVGYALATHEGIVPPQLHYRLDDPRANLPVLELHWRVHWYESEFATAMLERAVRVGAERVAQPQDEIAALLLFYQRDGFVGLRLACDIAGWWDRQGGDVPPGALGKLAAKHPGLERAWVAAALTAEQVVGVPGRQLLGQSPSTGRRRVRAAVRLSNWDLRGTEDRISTDVTLVDALCTPRGGFGAFANRTLLLDPARLREYYGLTEPRPVLERLVWAFHPLKIGLRYAASLAGIIGRVPLPRGPRRPRRSGPDRARGRVPPAPRTVRRRR
jgi:hypothetical protein